MTFEDFMNALNQRMVQRSGVSLYDLPDQDYRGLYEVDPNPDSEWLDIIADDILFEEGYE